MSLYFITGTDTNCGKTTATAELARYFSNLKKSVITQKWIQTGSINLQDDIDKHIENLNYSKEELSPFLAHMCPYKFKLASSAHLAAQKENIKIDIDTILNSIQTLENHFKTILIEGLGGICVPINDSQTTLDILCKINPKIILIIENKLGCINHALLTYSIIKANNLNCIGFIMNTKNNNLNPIIQNDTPDIIQKQTGLKKIGDLNFNKTLKLYTEI
jgi:dethiobiotin synthetase